jgi:hypothetical protein
MEKTAKVKVAFEGTDRRNEFRMEMPGGWLATLRCNGKWNLMSPELRRLIMKYRFCGMARPCFSPWGDRPEHEEVVTYSLMRELLDLATSFDDLYTNTCEGESHG